jgi:putative transposase
MKYNPDKHHRKTTRLQHYDYASTGAYFVTLCTQQREHLFGDVVDSEMKLNEYGKIVQDEWHKSAEIRKEIKLDGFVVMPNHVHGIVFIQPIEIESDMRPRVGAQGLAPLRKTKIQLRLVRPKKSLGSFVAGFKAGVTKGMNECRNTPGTPVWQRNYHEHIIRNDEDCNRIRNYIQHNPQNWATDEENQ